MSTKRLYPALIVVSIALAVLIYAAMIWSNCGSVGAADFLGDLRSFHSATGC
ncbi:hypothetical protein [Nesterenkonia halotolerans]|uniref:Peptidoglycan/LPS O-acetylase OafA/YrhL n=1 Tax=Nesterenkonia halotolerans TaxID=225325 RepID=A0ABR9J3W7_9MICC|nr:hypothetical protein [Nesterenkonia halotolerans]MBE1513654.1 peptidoglycan/LPS O-acetylase OafA/YrhL [Nesterenkonia halotolerans]